MINKEAQMLLYIAGILLPAYLSPEDRQTDALLSSHRPHVYLYEKDSVQLCASDCLT